jgi:type II secretory pathway pseudopilin PulG
LGERRQASNGVSRGIRLRTSTDERGFSLIEVMVAGVVAVVAVMGLAFTFSTGRGMIDRYAAARDALAAAEQRMDRLSILGLKDPSNAELAPGLHGPFPRPLDGNATGTEEWTVTWVDDPADNAGGDPNPNDYKQVTVDVRWTSGHLQDHVELSRIILGY